MQSFVRDLRYVGRAALRTPGFFIVTVLTLALGIGATTAIFTVINGVLLEPLPYPNPERLVQLWQVGEEGGQGQVSDPNFEDWQSQSRSFAAMAQYAERGMVSVSGSVEPVRARAATVSRDFFRVLGVTSVVGRTFSPEEQRVGGTPAVVVSQGFWQRVLGGRPDLGGATLRIGNTVFTVVGVMPASLTFPTGAEIWLPRELSERNPYRTGHNWKAIARLADGVTLEVAQREMSTIARRLKQQYGDETWMFDAAVVPLREQMVGQLRPALVLLLSASGFLLLIACANVVNLLVARMAARQGEIALRLALGAGRARLAQQFVTESLVLSLVGGAIGVLLAVLGVRALMALEPGNLPRLEEIRVSWTVLLFALAVSVAAASALGLFTALRGTRGDLRSALAQAQRTQAGAGSSNRIRSSLVVAQMALALVLLVGAGLLGRSFLRLIDVNTGYRTQRTVVLDMALPSSGDEAGRRQLVQFYDELVSRLGALPGVREVGGVNAFPLSGGRTSNGTFLIMSRPDEPLVMEDVPRLMRDPSRVGEAEFRVASAGYFRAMSIPLIRGRVFDDRDARDAPHVAVISQSLATTRWPGEDPIGKIIQFGNMDGDIRPFTIVGVVGDVRESSLAAEPSPTFYAFHRQRPLMASSINIAMHGDAAPETMIASAQRVVRDLRPDVPARFRTIETVISESVADRRFVLLLVAVFGAAALILATLGVYSVISFLVTQRKQEIGVRVALGAQTGDVLRLVLRQGATLAITGIAIGTLAALALTRLLSGLLYGIGVTDPVAFGLVIGGLTVVALLASYVPARRAARVQPMDILREP